MPSVPLGRYDNGMPSHCTAADDDVDDAANVLEVLDKEDPANQSVFIRICAYI